MERYQEALFRDRTVPGEREGEERWSLIEPFVPASGTMLDVGSNLGYFVVRAAQSRPDLSVVSMEIDPFLARRQSGVLASNEIQNAVLLQAGLTSQSASAWADTCDFFDSVLLLSIVHWFDEPEVVVGALSSMAGRIICEVPDSRDEGACGQELLRRIGDPVGWFEAVTGRHVSVIGQMARHTSDHKSWVLMVDGPVRRRPTLPYIGSTFDHPRGRDYEIVHDGRSTTIAIRGRSAPYKPGVNLHNLMSLGALRYPDPAAFYAMADAELDEHVEHPDPLAHNMLWSGAGLTLVDFEPVAGLTTANDARRALHQNLASWSHGSTVRDGVVIRHHSMWQRVRYSRLIRPVVRRIPRRLKLLIRSIVVRTSRWLKRGGRTASARRAPR